MKVALIGLLESGKSTIFSAISSKRCHRVGRWPSWRRSCRCRTSDRLAHRALQAEEDTYATIDCLDVPGFDFEDDHGRAAARRLIGQIRTVDMLVLVVRAFEDPGGGDLSQ